MNTNTTLQPMVVHRLPGRLRVHLPEGLGGGRERIEQQLRELPGTRAVTVNALTSNVLVLFDPAVTNEEAILRALAAAVPQVACREQPGGALPAWAGWAVRAGLRGLAQGAVVDVLLSVASLAEPSGIAGAGIRALRLGFDVFEWGNTLAPLLLRAAAGPADSRACGQPA